MNTSLEYLVANLSKVGNISCKKCKGGYNVKSERQYINYSDKKLIYKCNKCNSISHKPIKILVAQCPNIYRFCNKDSNKFMLLLKKAVYHYEYMDSWERFDKTSLPNKEYFYSKLILKHISEADHTHVQKVWDTFNIKNLGEYHDLYVQCDTVQLAHVFERFRETCIEIYQLDPAYFISAPGLAWQACLKKTRVKVELLTDYDMLLMMESGIRGGICQSIHRYAETNNKYMKNHNKNVPSTYLMYLSTNNSYGWAMCKKLSVSNFRWSEDLNKYTEDFIKNYDENSDYGSVLNVDIDYPKNVWGLHKDLPFLPERRKLGNLEKLITSIVDKKLYNTHICIKTSTKSQIDIKKSTQSNRI